jgi:small-conductance mechanosensitive channel
MNEIGELASRVYFGNELRNWLAAAASFALWFTVLPIVRVFLLRRLRQLHPAQSAQALEMALALLGATTRLFLLVVAAWLSLRWLNIPKKLDRGVEIAFLVILWFQIGVWAMTLVKHIIYTRQRVTSATEGAAGLNILRFITVAAVWIIAFLMLLANLGVAIMPLVAGLGIGGLAIALAVQNVLGDLLASLSIALDKPFKVGDFLVIGEERGRVEQIGIKSTRLRATTGEQIVMSNGDLLKSRLRNYGHRAERRAELQLRIIYETPRALIGEVPGIIESVIRAHEKARFERAHFVRYGDWALIFEAVYFVLDSELNVFMDVQQAVNLHLMDEFARRGIQFAYPTSRAVSMPLPASPT